MTAVELIHKKRWGDELSRAQIEWLISGYTAGVVTDYQMSAWCMAVCFRGLTDAETAHLTMAMTNSGDTVDLSGIQGCKVDKHSTGGVADTTTLILGPIVAACGAKMAKMSGRGLGHTGGTVDKLLSIPGMRVEFAVPEFIRLVERVGLAVVGQSADLAPADKRMYALRDATGTVDAMGLIASSIMSKKLAAGADAILLDVKVGRGAFLPTYEQAHDLARLMTRIGSLAGRRVEAALTDMEEPLGNAIGNALEVTEAIDTLSGRGPRRLTDLCVTLAGRLLAMAGLCSSPKRGEVMARGALADGRALAKLGEMIEAQGGDRRVVEERGLLPSAPICIEVPSPARGYVVSLDALALGEGSIPLGAGRLRKEDPIDPAVGIVIAKRVGDHVDVREPLAVIHASDRDRARACLGAVTAAYGIGPEAPRVRPLVYEWVI